MLVGALNVEKHTKFGDPLSFHDGIGFAGHYTSK
jgi:hypothetical protein